MFRKQREQVRTQWEHSFVSALKFETAGRSKFIKGSKTHPMSSDYVSWWQSTHPFRWLPSSKLFATSLFDWLHLYVITNQGNFHLLPKCRVQWLMSVIPAQGDWDRRIANLRLCRLDYITDSIFKKGRMEGRETYNNQTPKSNTKK